MTTRDQRLVTAIGELTRLGEVVRLEYGFSLTQDKRRNGSVPVIGSAGILGYHDQAKVQGPGIVVGRKGSIGSVTWVTENFVPIDTTYFAVPIDGKADLRWLHHLLARENLSTLNRATGVPGLNRDDVYALRRWVPPLPEQRAIAEVLNAIDEAIERTEAVIDATERLRGALLHELLTRGVPGQHSEWREVPGLGTVPADWDVVRLGEVAEVAFSSVDKRTVDGEIPVRLCNYMDVFNNRRIRSGMTFMSATATPKEYDRWELKRGDVLFTKDSETPSEIGIPAYVTETMPGVLCGYHIGMARPHELLDGAWLAELMRSSGMARQFGRIANGVTRFGLTLRATESLGMPLPPLAEQRAIAATLSNVDNALERAREEQSRLQSLKASTSDALLTGRVRVKINEEACPG